jgi:hypothetical protein
VEWGGDMNFDSLGQLLASDHRRTLEFFFIGLKDVSDSEVDTRELLYNASILAHYAQVSTASVTDFPTPRSLSCVFDNFVIENTSHNDAVMMETAGTHCLLMAGFFEDQVRSKHNIIWYGNLGAGFFYRAAKIQDIRAKANLLYIMCKNFETWRLRYSKLGRELRKTPFLLNLPTPPQIQ